MIMPSLRRHYTTAVKNAIRRTETEILGYDRYVTDLLQEAGNPSDPVERMLVEQLVLAHHKIGSLHAEAAGAKGTAAALCNAAAARLMAEFRKSALALKTYRTSSAVLQAAPAKPADLTMTTTANGSTEQGTAESHASLYAQLRNGNGHGHPEITPRFCQSQAGCSREKECVKAAGAHP
jgi:hypothetical protein